LVLGDLNWFVAHGNGKKIYLTEVRHQTPKLGDGSPDILTQNGWPSQTSSSAQPNSPYAVANVENEQVSLRQLLDRVKTLLTMDQAYYALLDQHCSDFKAVAGGGVGWFAHIYSDNMEPGYGIYGTNGALKFPFRPRTSC